MSKHFKGEDDQPLDAAAAPSYGEEGSVASAGAAGDPVAPAQDPADAEPQPPAVSYQRGAYSRSRSAVRAEQGLSGQRGEGADPASGAGDGYAFPSADEYSFDGSFSSSDDLVRHKHRRRKKHTGLKVAGAVLAVLVVVCGVCGVLLFGSAKELKAQASSALAQVSTIQKSITARDFDGAADAAQSLQSTASQLDESLSSPLWSAASFLPVVGSDVSGVRTVASVLKDASANALVPLTQALKETPIDSLVSDGTIDVDALSNILSAVEDAAPVMQRCADKLNTVPDMHIEALQSPISSAKEKLSDANDLFQTAADVAPVAKALLGGSGDRTYLLVAQNSAELRASDGFPGSMGTLTISDGHISLGDFAKVYDVLGEDTPASVQITSEETSLFYSYTRYSWDNSFNPDFERVGAIWAASYEERNGGELDGVVSFTPAIVQRLLSALGTSITLSDGTVLDGTNATKVLEHDLYWTYLSNESTIDSSVAGDLTDALFSEAAALAFDQVLGNMSADTLTKLTTVLMDGAKNREVLVWLADDSEQAQMRELGVTGALDASTQAAPTLGVFSNIWFGSKIGWWYGMDTQVGEASVAADGARTYHVTTTLENYLTADELANGGTYIIGGLDETGYYEPFVYLYAPAGGSIQNVSASNGAQFQTAEYKGLQVAFTPDVTGGSDEAHPANPVYPNEPVTISYDVVLPASVKGDLALSATPTLQQYR